jgi:hypothetical protein
MKVSTSESESKSHARIFFDNHSSSQLDSDFISSYIADEQAVNCYSAAFRPEDLEQLIGPFRTSPLGLVPKPHTDSFRMIQDMSFPRNNPNISSVNHGINVSDFPTAWGSFDETVALILLLPDGCLAATFDISAAYRLTPIRPDQQHHLCVFWKGLVYVDRAVMFGLASSAGVFGAIGDMLIAIYKRAGFTQILKWVDDFFVIRLPNQSWTEREFMDLTGYFGIPWSSKKMRPLASTQRYIGFDWNLDSRTVALPLEKLAKTLSLLTQWLAPNERFLAREAASLHGKLVHISCIFPLIRPFLRGIASFALGFLSPRAKLCVPPNLQADLSWVQFIIKNLPNEIPLAPQQPLDLQWWGNASTSFGIGIALGCHWAVWKWAPGFKVGPRQEFDIGWAEAIAVELGLRLAISLNFLSRSCMAGHTFLVRSDNAGVVVVTNKGRSRSRETNKILKHIYLLQAQHQIRLKTVHVTSRENISDALSRGAIAEFLTGFPSVNSQVSIPLPDHLLDKLISL